MTRLYRSILSLSSFALFALVSSLLMARPALASAYEVRLPAELHTASELCAHAPCESVLPAAHSFSARKGQPSYVEGFDAEGRLVGYVMLSSDITDIPAYSGKPIFTLIGMDSEGHFTGVRILKHSEPILLLGIPETALTGFNEQYIGKHVGDRIEVGRARAGEEVVSLDAISGATVTIIAQNRSVMESATAIARQTGMLEPISREQRPFVERGHTPDWEALVAEGSVQQLIVDKTEVGLEDDGTPFIELWFGLLNQPDIGRAILGETVWSRLMERIDGDDQAIFVMRTAGRESFKGSGFVRGGIFDRIQVRQDVDTFTFYDLDYVNLFNVAAAGAPRFTESGIFIIRGDAFSPAYPWSLVFLGNRIEAATGQRSFASFSADYWLADAYLEGGRATMRAPQAAWVRVWQMRALEIGLFVALLGMVTLAYANRDRLTRRATHRNKWPVNAFKYTAWVISIFYVGFYLMAQPSITQVLTWFHALLLDWRWELFLLDPFIFIFWIFIIVTVFVWGRGLFCGWLCPFGSLSELLYKIGHATPLKRFQFQLSQRVHDRLKWVKYGVFFVLLAVSVFSFTTAEMLAEVEPFKTTFLVGMFNRAWPYTLFVAVLLGLSIFTERPFCKYLCPLGAALAMPTTFRWFGLRRKQECTSCKACAKGCGSLAIDDKGRIDPRECMLCLDCMVLYTDAHACPPLSQERKRREKAGLPLSPIGRDGYYIPIQPVAARAPAPAARPEPLS